MTSGTATINAASTKGAWLVVYVKAVSTKPRKTPTARDRPRHSRRATSARGGEETDGCLERVAAFTKAG
jgi:hypothetical protein